MKKHPIYDLPVKIVTKKKLDSYEDGGRISMDEAYIRASDDYDQAIEDLARYYVNNEMPVEMPLIPIVIFTMIVLFFTGLLVRFG